MAAFNETVVSMAYVYSLRSGAADLSPPTFGIDDLPWLGQLVGTFDQAGYVYVTRRLLMAALQRMSTYGYRITQAVALEEES